MMKKKRLVVFLLATMLFVSFVMSSFAAVNATEAVEYSSIPLAPADFDTNPIYTSQFSILKQSRAASAVTSTISVTFLGLCDEEWRAYYGTPAWRREVFDTLDSAELLMNSQFGIDLDGAVAHFTSPNTSTNNGQNVLDAAINASSSFSDWDIMVAFSGQMHGYGGLANTFNPKYCIIFDQHSRAANAVSARHEIGHLYGCPDHQIPAVSCLMSVPYSNYNNLCSSCYNTWNSNKARH